MTKQRIIIGASVLAGAVCLALGVTGDLTISKGRSAWAQAPSDNPAASGPRTNTKIEQLKAHLDAVAQYESAHGCMAVGRHGQLEFCSESKTKVDAIHEQLVKAVHELELADRSAEALALVKANVQALSGDRSADITFAGTSRNPYTSTTKRIEYWQDSKGFLYLVDPATNMVVQFGPGPDIVIPFELDGSKSRPMAQLQAIAEAYLFSHVPDFHWVKSSFEFRQISKPDNVSHAFRWESKSALEGEGMAPFVQVVLSPAGEIMSFNDVRSLYTK